MIKIPPSLKHKKFVYLIIGLGISIIGSRMQFTALLWHVNSLTEAPIALGTVGLVRILPVIIFSLVGGVVADTIERKKILFVTQAIQTITALTLGYLTLTGQIVLWHLYLLTAIEGATFSFDLPARQSLTPNLVPKADLVNAFSISSLVFTASSIVGPLFAGIVLAAPSLGQGYTYILNGVSYIAIFVALILLGDVPQLITKGQKIEIGAIKEGVKFIKKPPLILSTMMLDFVATFFSSATALLPIFATKILNIGAVGYGTLSAAQSVGSVITAIFLTQVEHLRKQGPLLLGFVVLYGIATILFGLAPTLLLAFLALMLVGASDTVSTVIRNTIRQLQTPDELRGRMVSINQIFFMGGPQLGEMEAGVVAQFFGPIFAVVSGGIACIVGVIVIMGIWPQIKSYNGDEEIAAG